MIFFDQIILLIKLDVKYEVWLYLDFLKVHFVFLYLKLFSMIFENRYAIYEEKGNMLYATYEQGGFIDLVAAKTLVKDRLEFQNGKKYKLLVDCRAHFITTATGRKYLAHEGSEGLTRVAIVYSSSVCWYFLDLYMRVARPLVETKIFKDESKALEWLNSSDESNSTVDVNFVSSNESMD